MDTKTILIANPCDAERALLTHALAAQGFRVIQATCAKDAITAAQSEHPQLVVLDTFGWESPTLTTLNVLKHQANTCRIPVVIFGNPRTKEEVSEAIQKGAASWIGRKGFDLSRFIDKLGGIIAARPAADFAPAASAGRGLGPSPVEPLTQPTVESTLAQAGHLPVFEFSVVDAVTTTCAKDQAAQHVAGILERDPMMTLALLAEANRHASTHEQATSNPRRAIQEMGTKSFYRLVENVSPLKLSLSSIWDPGFYWAHSVATARIAGMLSRMVGLATPAAAVTAGLLHDLGSFVLANCFPKQYGALFSAGIDLDSIGPAWEKSVVGAHHGEIGAWAMNHYKLPAVVSDSAVMHHAGSLVGQTLTPLSRLVGMVVQAADSLAVALFPSDPPLVSLANPFAEFETVLAEKPVNVDALIDQSRQIVAEMLTEMPYLFPQSSVRSFFYGSEPLNDVAYFAPRAHKLDVFRLFLEVRSRSLTVLDARSIRNPPPHVPMVINLSRVREPGAQIELLTSLMASRVMENRSGVVLVPAALPDRAMQTLITPDWRLVPLPAHCNRWVRFLEQSPCNQNLHVAVA